MTKTEQLTIHKLLDVMYLHMPAIDLNSYAEEENEFIKAFWDLHEFINNSKKV